MVDADMAALECEGRDRQADDRRPITNAQLSACLTARPTHRRASQPGRVRAVTHVCGRKFTNLLVATRRASDLTDRAATFDSFRAEAAGRHRRGGPGRRASWPTTPTWPILSEKPCDPGQPVDAVAARVPRCCSWACRIYPKLPRQPIPESALLTGPLVSTTRTRDRQNRRHPCGPGGAPPTWLAVIRDAQPVRARRQLFANWLGHLLPALIRRHDEAKASGAPNAPTGGTGTPPTGAAARRRPGERTPVSAGTFRRADPCQRGNRHRPHHRRSPRWSPRR